MRSGSELALAPGKAFRVADVDEELFEKYVALREQYPADTRETILMRLSRLTGEDPARLQEIHEAQGWSARYLEYEFLTTAGIVEAMHASSVRRHLTLAWMMQETARQALQRSLEGQMPVRNPEEARRLAVSGVEMERLVSGQATQRVEVDRREAGERIRWLLGQLRRYEGLDLGDLIGEPESLPASEPESLPASEPEPESLPVSEPEPESLPASEPEPEPGSLRPPLDFP